MRKTLLLAWIFLLAAAPAAAQEPPPRAELYAGYSYARLNPGGLAGNEMNLNGWNAAIQGNVTNWFGIVGDFSGHYGTRAGVDVNTHQALFGPRLTLRGPISPFVHALFGVARGNAGLFGSTESVSAFGMALGGGVDIPLGRHASWRLVQADYLMTRFHNARRDNARISTGLVFRF
jgi:hypothetical protein